MTDGTSMGYPNMMIGPVRLCVLAGLAFLWLYSVASVDRRFRRHGGARPYLNLGTLLIGPVMWVILLVNERRSFSIKDVRPQLVQFARALWQRAVGKERYDEQVVTVLAHADGTPVGQGSVKSLGRNEAFALTLARQMVDWGITSRASDLFLDPRVDQGYDLRYRVDGFVRLHQQIERNVAMAALNCFKIIAEMDIAERRRAQDGGLMALYQDRQIKLRVASTGTVYGEKMTIRILDARADLLELDQVGLSEKYMALLRRNIRRPYGMILVCGPTGSGKTTTLYACIKELADTGRNIITIEDPIEYALPIASQMAVNTKAGITFATQLRHVLRQSPDVIMVGEIRDAETAKIALQASETGHLVFSTLHANDAITGLLRLMDLGIEPFLISASVTCALSQRLVRRVCPHCRGRLMVPDRLRREATKRNIPLDGLYEPRGCEACGQTGYSGREGIFEILEMSAELGEVLKTRPTPAAVRKIVRDQGMTTMQQDGMAKVLSGLTSVPEVVRVAGY